MQTDTFNLAWVHSACEHVLGKNIRPRTWRNFLRICGIRQYQREVRLKECSYLLGLVYLKRQNPFKKYSLSDVSLLLRQDKQRLAKFGIDLEKFDFPLSGRELPAYIYEQTSRKVSLRTLYRWASKYNLSFSVSKTITPQELKEWLEIGSAAA
ncbi:MAG: DNA-binding protein (plasmid) [Nodularia sp. CChRGM 3473]